MVVDPAATAVKGNVALDDPDATSTVAGTVATPVLLLDNETVAPAAGAAALSVTVPWTVPPAATLAGFSVTAVTLTVVPPPPPPPPPPVFPVGEPLHWTTQSAVTTAAIIMRSFIGRVLFMAISVRRISER
jgi:hypothetical protein